MLTRWGGKGVLNGGKAQLDITETNQKKKGQSLLIPSDIAGPAILKTYLPDIVTLEAMGHVQPSFIRITLKSGPRPFWTPQKGRSGVRPTMPRA